MFFEEALLALSDPPITEAVQQHLCRAHSADSSTRRVRIGIDTTYDWMKIHEELKLDERRELPWLSLDMSDDLPGTSWVLVSAVVGIDEGQRVNVPLGRYVVATDVAHSSSPT